MANCYICGAPILDTRVRLRRKVKTGEHSRRSFPSGRVVSVQSHFGVRVVCKFCASRIDRKDFVRRFQDLFLVVVACLILMAAFLAFDFLY